MKVKFSFKTYPEMRLMYASNFVFKEKKTGLSFTRPGGLMVSALVPGSSGLGSSPNRGHCVVLLGKTLHSHSASLHSGV